MSKAADSLTLLAMRKPKQTFWFSGLLALLFILCVLAPSIHSDIAKVMHPLAIDTDPENMLSYDEPVKVFHRQQKQQFALSDMIVIGVTDTQHSQGVFNPDTLSKIHDLALFAKGITWQNKQGEQVGVIGADLMSPSTLENIEQAGAGAISFSWLMEHPPTTDAQALALRDKIQNLPLFNGTLLSDDGQAIALYIPITSKDISYNVAELLKERIATYQGDAQFHITGMPVAQDVFGVEMFKQMAISAPMAMILIYLIMWFFFKKAVFVTSPMIVAMASVIITMGLLVISGNVIHIMSSMIPIFIMPIAVLDGVHILSDFYDRYPQLKDRRKTLQHVMNDLHQPMLFTTITTAVGFGSLALTPIPPVQVFGVFVAIGVILAWLFTITMIPAYIMLMSDQSLERLQGNAKGQTTPIDNTFLARALSKLGTSTYQNPKIILTSLALIAAGASYGFSMIVTNDNPVKWFAPEHPIRVADKILNDKFAGTYMAYLNLSKKATKEQQIDFSNRLKQTLLNSDSQALQQVANIIEPDTAIEQSALYAKLISAAETQLSNMEDASAVEDETLDVWEQAIDTLTEQSQQQQYFKDPEVLNYMGQLQQYLVETGLVGKSNSLADVVKTVHREVYSGEQQDYRIPDTSSAVAQLLLTYQNSHRPQDLWHFVTPDYQNSTLWLQLKSGDNTDMSELITLVNAFFEQHPAPAGLTHDWFGLTYINVVWQEKMVGGMANAFIGSFGLVFIMMTLLFRSVLWGALAMVPLAFTITVIYGVIGLIGKDYDMPVAVLSSLSLGLAVDYAIHFIARARELSKNHPNWRSTAKAVFAEPARAISRNVIVVGVGFLPLLIAPLVPYQTVGVFISAILLLAGIATLVVLPALIVLLEKPLFKNSYRK